VTRDPRGASRYDAVAAAAAPRRRPEPLRAMIQLLLATLSALPMACMAATTPAPSQEEARAPFDHSHAPWTAILKQHVRDGGFDYAALKRDRGAFDAYLATLAAVTPQELAAWSEKQRHAFWIDVYNAFCIRKVVDEYPLKSIRKLDGAFGLNSVFDKGFIPMAAHHPKGADEPLSLNDVEHEILRKRFKDAHVHAAINCASVSCPPLRAEAFVAERLDEQLEEQMRAFVNDPTRNRIDPAKKELAVSEIFKWFAEDFERAAKSVKEYLVRYTPAEKHDFIRSAKLRYLDYDWDLNDAPAR
jgi:hypothetical protein